jgi:chromosome partitioning protein
VRTLAVINQKGGSGKTTTAINLAAVWAATGRRTLLVDMDPQGHCAAGLAVPDDAIEGHIGSAMLRPATKTPDLRALAWRISTNLDLVPSSMQLAGLEAPRGGLADRPDKDLRLTHLLTPLSEHYDACVIDCPPSIGLLTFNALRAAEEVLIPVETSYFALQGAERQVKTIRSLTHRLGRSIRFYLLPTLHRSDSKLASEILAALKNRFVRDLAPVVVHYDEKLREAAGFGQSIVEYAAGSVGHRDYAALGAWLENQSATEEKPGVPMVEVAGGAREALLNTLSSAGGVRSPLGAGAPQRLGPGGRAIEAKPEKSKALAAQQSGGATRPENKPGSRAAELAERARLLMSRTLRRDASPKPRAVDPRVTPKRESNGAVVATAPAPARAAGPSAAMLKRLGPTKTSQGVLFVYDGAAKAVFLAGDFNGWSRWGTPLKYHEQHGVWYACLPLEPGRYAYRYVRDEEWICDPNNDRREGNPFGGENSIVEVSET